MTTQSAVRGLALVCLAGVLWGTGGVAVQIIRAHSDLSALVISGYRTGIAATVLVVACVATAQWAAAVRITRARPGAMLLVGLATAAYQGLYFTSVVWVGVTISTMVSLGTAPVLLALRDMMRARRIEVIRAVQVLAAVTGLVLVSGSGESAQGFTDLSGTAAWGVVAALASGTGYALATAVGEGLARSAPPLALTAAATLIGATVLVPLAAVSPGPHLTTSPTAAGTLLYLGVATFAIAYFCLYAGLRSTSSAAAVLALLIEPVTAAAAAALLLGERISAAGLVGIVLVLLAIASLGLESD